MLLRRTLALAASLISIVTATAAAQGIIPLNAEENHAPIGGVFPLGGVRYDRATGATVHLALIRTDASTLGSYAGWLISGEAGLRGGKIGFGRGSGPTSSYPGMFRAAVLRTWGTGGPLAPGQEFVGLELRHGAHNVTLGIGEFVRFKGSANGDGHLFDWSVGFGF